jgi:hypothetical protein
MEKHWAMHTPLCPGGGGKVSPLPQRCTLPAHEEATLPCVSYHDNNVIVAIAMAVTIAITVAFSVNIAVAIAVAVGQCYRRCRRPLPLLSPSAINVAVTLGHCAIAVAIAIAVADGNCRCHQPLPLPLLPAIAIAIAVAIAIAIAIAICHRHCRHRHRNHRHCHCRLCWTSLLPSPLQAPSPPEKEEALIGEFCLGAVTIILKQFTQTMLTLFCFVQTVSSALITAND